MLHLRALLADFQGGNERLEILVLPFQQLSLLVHILLHPIDDRLQGMERVLGGIVNDLLAQDLLPEELLDGLVEDPGAFARLRRKLAQREGVFLEEVPEDEDLRSGEPGLL
jgi:hypothetical protein